jgi:hypothetical protein
MSFHMISMQFSYSYDLSHSHDISLISLSLHCNLQNSLSSLYITSMCREHSTTVNYQGSHLVVRVRAVAHLVLEVADPLLLEIAALVTMTVMISS